ncbi:Lrp/AsnC family transcriptional regulator [Clostridiaceae bacterium 35-E11]
MLDALDKQIIIALSEELPITTEPFKEISNQLNIPLETLLHRLGQLQAFGYLKRISPILNHYKTKYIHNAMTAWIVPQHQLAVTLQVMQSNMNISHIYERVTYEDWPYNVFGMIHGTSEAEVREIIDEISHKAAIQDFVVLYTEKQWKKTSPCITTLID